MLTITPLEEETKLNSVFVRVLAGDMLTVKSISINGLMKA